MMIPTVSFIEAALEQLTEQDPKALQRELKEFRMLGTARLQRIAVPVAVGDAPSILELGYLLGLETARALLAGMPDAVIHKINI